MLMLMLTPRALGFAICMTAATVVAQDRAFLDRLSADAGETVQVFVSTTSPTYKVSLLRSYDFGSSALVAESGDIAGTAQPTFPGSRCRVASTAALEIRDRITLEVWVYIHRRVKHVCGILSKCGREAEAAYSLCLDGSGKLILFLGATGAFEPEDRLTSNAAVPAGEWTHIVATYDGQTVVLYVNGEPDASKTRTGPIYDSKEPVRIGWGSDGATAGAASTAISIRQRSTGACCRRTRFELATRRGRTTGTANRVCWRAASRSGTSRSWRGPS